MEKAFKYNSHDYCWVAYTKYFFIDYVLVGLWMYKFPPWQSLFCLALLSTPISLEYLIIWGRLCDVLLQVQYVEPAYIPCEKNTLIPNFLFDRIGDVPKPETHARQVRSIMHAPRWHFYSQGYIPNIQCIYEHTSVPKTEGVYMRMRRCDCRWCGSGHVRTFRYTEEENEMPGSRPVRERELRNIVQIAKPQYKQCWGQIWNKCAQAHYWASICTGLGLHDRSRKKKFSSL